MRSTAYVPLAPQLALYPCVLAHPPSRVARLPDDGSRLHGRIMPRSASREVRTFRPERRGLRAGLANQILRYG